MTDQDIFDEYKNGYTLMLNAGNTTSNTYSVTYPGNLSEYMSFSEEPLPELYEYTMHGPALTHIDEEELKSIRKREDKNAYLSERLINGWYVFHEDERTYYECGTELMLWDPREVSEIGQVELNLSGGDGKLSDVFYVGGLVRDSSECITFHCINMEKCIDYKMDIPIKEFGYDNKVTINLPVGFYMIRVKTEELPFDCKTAKNIENYVQCYVRTTRITHAQFYFVSPSQRRETSVSLNDTNNTGNTDLSYAVYSAVNIIPLLIAGVIASKMGIKRGMKHDKKN